MSGVIPLIHSGSLRIRWARGLVSIVETLSLSLVYVLVRAPLQAPSTGLTCTHMSIEELPELMFERSETLCTTVRHGL